MSNWAATVFVVLATTVPWMLCALPLAARVAATVLVGGTGLLFWCAAAVRRRRSSIRLLLASDLLSLSVAAGWISVASYSAQLSRAGTAWIYGVVVASIGVSCLVSLALLGGRQGRRQPESLLLILPLLLSASVFLARPGRRFRGTDRESIQPVAETLGSVREASAWVKENIVYGRAPFVDTAKDTLERKLGTCSGHANVLHKILLVHGLDSRIVHLEAKGRLHTLVEYFDDALGKWILVDPGRGLDGRDYGNADGFALMGSRHRGLPSKWRPFTRLYVYDSMNGYIRLTPANRDRFYQRENQ